MARRKLTDKQARFVEEYLIDLNATQAAIRAGYSAKTADSQAAQLVANPKVAEAIQKAKEKFSNKLEISAERVLQEMAALAFSDLGDVMAWGPDAESTELYPSEELKPEHRRAVSSVKVRKMVLKSRGVDEDGEPSVHVEESILSTEIKLHDKSKALDQLARHLGLFDKDNEQRKPEIHIEVPDAMAAIDEKMDEIRSRMKD